MKRIPARLAQSEILELGSQNSLDILGLDGKKVLSIQHLNAKSRHVPALTGGHFINATLDQLRNKLLLVCTEAFPQVADSQPVAGIGWDSATAQTAGVTGMLDGSQNAPDHAKSNGSSHEQQQETRGHGGELFGRQHQRQP